MISDVKLFVATYVLPRMTMSAIEERLGAILETDWRHEAGLLDNVRL